MSASKIARAAAREHEADAQRIARDAEHLAAAGRPEAAEALADPTAEQAPGSAYN